MARELPTDSKSHISNLEWECGYGPRFGLTYVDKEDNFKRIPKHSSKVVKQIWEHVIKGKQGPELNGHS